MNEMTNTETRDIILDVTEKLIYRHGIAATGMDFLVKTAGVSRKSIYRYFANKDDLVIAALQRRDERWMQWLRDEVERREGTGERLLALFSALKDWFGTADFRGCAFINVFGELGAVSPPVASAVRSVSCAWRTPIETTTTSVATPFSFSRIASSTAISSKGFMLILTFARSTPDPSALTRTFTL